MVPRRIKAGAASKNDSLNNSFDKPIGQVKDPFAKYDNPNNLDLGNKKNVFDN